MRSIWLLFTFAASLLATQSLRLGTGATGTANMGSSAPFSRTSILNTTQVFEFRLHGISGAAIPQPGQRTLFTTNNTTFWAYLMSNGQLNITNWFDQFGDGDGNDTIDITGRTDIVIRVVRKPSTMQYWIEMWNIDGTGYALGSVKTISSLGTGPQSGGGSATLNQLNLDASTWTNTAIAWWRWKSAISVSPGDNPPQGTDIVSGIMAAFEFESESSNATPDSSGKGHTLALAGTRQYVTSPIYVPACSAGFPSTFKAGISVALDGSKSNALDDGPALSYEWWQISGSSDLMWDSHTIQNPTVSGSISGSYVFGLRVKDSSGQTSSCSVQHGFVATDTKGIALIPNAAHGAFIKNLTRLGVNPWPWFDDRQKTFLDWLVDNIDTLYSTYWDSEDAGTIQVTSNQIIGTGTSFKSLFCGGGTDPVANANTQWFQIVLHYPYKTGVGYDGLIGHQALPIWRCTSDTLLEIGRYNGDTAFFWSGNTIIPNAGTSGLKYNIVDGTKYGRWAFGARPLNYYDQVLALYAMYYRTGNNKYRTTARTLADRFWTQPQLDRGARYDGVGNGIVFPNRSLSLTGIILRALDSPSEDMMPGLRRMLNYFLNIAVLHNEPDNYDFREGGYAVKWISEIGIVDPSSRSAAVSKILDMLTNKWTPQRQPDGSWNNFSGGWFHTALGGINGVGTVTLTNGSTAVVGDGTANLNSGIGNEDACNVVGNYIVFYPTSANWYTTSSGANTGDPIGYQIASVTDDNHMTLSSPYAGTTGSKYWACGGGNTAHSAIGMGKQPYMLGITAQAFVRASELLAVADAAAYASQISLYRSYAVDVGTWLQNNRSSDGGIYYFKTSPSCEGPIVSTQWCDTGRANILNFAEAAYANAAAYLISPSSGLATTNDAVWSMMFGKPVTGALADDSRWIWELENYMATTSDPNTMGKWTGIFFGVGRLAEWPAIRLGGLDNPNNKTVPIWLGSPTSFTPSCVSWMVTVADASGVITSSTTTTAASLNLTADARTTGGLITATCKNAGGQPARPPLVFPVTVQ